VQYYTEAGPDYAVWSPGLHMHFGLWRRGLNPLRREAMLIEMARAAFARIDNAASAPLWLDAGCGLGASARLAAEDRPGRRVCGVTPVPWQVARARRLTAQRLLARRVRFYRMDYQRMAFADASFDGAYLLESSCYATGAGKNRLIDELHRVLKPGARLCVTDGFLKPGARLGWFLRRIANYVLKSWKIAELADSAAFVAALEKAGFINIRVEDVSWKVAPSFLHVPFVTLGFFLREILIERKPLTPERIHNALAPLAALVLGAARRKYSYMLISAQKTGV
jgi:MPBQ/MSBQ methyltransferase